MTNFDNLLLAVLASWTQLRMDDMDGQKIIGTTKLPVWTQFYSRHPDIA